MVPSVDISGLISGYFKMPRRTATHTATHCNIPGMERLECIHSTATHCNTLQHTATHCTTLQHTAAHCTTLQHTAPHCNTLQHTAPHCTTLQHTATHCNIVKREREKGHKHCLVKSKVTRDSQNRPTHVRRDQQIPNEVDDVAITSQEIVWQLCWKLYSTTCVCPKNSVQ